MDARNGSDSVRRRPRFDPLLERLEGRQILSVTPLIYFGSPGSTPPPGAVATAAPSVVPHLPTAREQVLEKFFALFKGVYQASPARFTDQVQQFFFAASGLSSGFKHGDIEMAVYTPADPSQPVTGSAFMIVKNYGNTGNSLGVDLTADASSLDALGRPTQMTWTVNGNSGGAFADATGSGTLDIKYFPSHGHARGLFGSAQVGLIFQGTITTNRVTNSVRFT